MLEDDGEQIFRVQAASLSVMTRCWISQQLVITQVDNGLAEQALQLKTSHHNQSQGFQLGGSPTRGGLSRGWIDDKKRQEEINLRR